MSDRPREDLTNQMAGLTAQVDDQLVRLGDEQAPTRSLVMVETRDEDGNITLCWASYGFNCVTDALGFLRHMQINLEEQLRMQVQLPPLQNTGHD